MPLEDCERKSNMSKRCWLAVVCLPVIFWSLDHAQPTTDDVPCGSSALEDVTQEIRADVKKLLASNTILIAAGQPSKQALVSAFLCEYPSDLVSGAHEPIL